MPKEDPYYSHPSLRILVHPRRAHNNRATWNLLKRVATSIGVWPRLSSLRSIELCFAFK
jgi:hypothetical protein